MVYSRQPDSGRSYRLYRYLLGRLAISRRSDGSPNNSQTAQRVGDDALRRIISAVLADEDTWHQSVSANSNTAKVTTGRLVEMLGTLKETLAEDYKAYDEHYSRVLTTEDVLIALYQLTELSPEERQRLDLPVGDKLTLLQQTLLSLQTKDGTENYEAIFKAYKEAVGLEFTPSGAPVSNLNQVNDLIEGSVRAALSYLPKRPTRFRDQLKEPGNEDTIIELSRKAQREVRRLLVRSGNTQFLLVDNAANHPFISRYLQPAFIRKLSQTVVNNQRLTAQLPVYLKQVTIEARGPLPFFDTSLGEDKRSSPYPRLLNVSLQELDGNTEHVLLNDEIPSPSDYELASQEVNKLTLGFYLKVPDSYESVIPDTFKTISSDCIEAQRPYYRVDFTYSSTGVGGTLSHIVKVINKTLLSDIPCLSRFFPIAHDVTSTQTIIKENVSSPIWAHSLVKLCHNRSVGQALRVFEESDSPYDDFSFGDPTGRGDFCGFDFLIAQAQSSLQARLQAICNTGIDPDAYIQQLCGKVERQLMLKRAWQKLKYYPFSSMAMVGTIRDTILGTTFKARSLNRDDANIYFDAFLSIAEALLEEGAYRAGYCNLKKIEIIETYARDSLALTGSADVNGDRSEVFSSHLTVRYLICKATYYYLYDLQENNPKYSREFLSDLTRQQLVIKAWETLDLAEEHVKARLKKYIVIGEVSQGTFTPHYKLLSRIYLLRARLLTFFPRLVPTSEEWLPTENFSGQQRTEASVHWGKIYLLEKARLYVAADGESEAYTYYAALQSCYYLTAAYADSENVKLSDPNTRSTRTLSRDHCLVWAKRLRDHALLTYTKIGRQCYNAIKEKSGLPDTFEPYGRYDIERLPAIFEDRGLEKNREVSDDNEFLTLDISLLAISKEDIPKLTADTADKSIYLFGTNTCHLFFARGLYLLCSDTTEEFEKDEVEDPIDWVSKLALAKRLFNLAWAIAEDGCKIERNREKGIKNKKITRSFKENATATQYSSREIDSVRDLYPRRVNELADIGKIFSAACMTLQLHILPTKERSSVVKDIDKIFAMLHGEYRLQSNPLLKAPLFRQKRYNGHLEDFLINTRRVLESHRPQRSTLTASEPAADEEMQAHRDRLMKALFATLLL